MVRQNDAPPVESSDQTVTGESTVMSGIQGPPRRLVANGGDANDSHDGVATHNPNDATHGEVQPHSSDDYVHQDADNEDDDNHRTDPSANLLPPQYSSAQTSRPPDHHERQLPPSSYPRKNHQSRNHIEEDEQSNVEVESVSPDGQVKIWEVPPPTLSTPRQGQGDYDAESEPTPLTQRMQNNNNNNNNTIQDETVTTKSEAPLEESSPKADEPILTHHLGVEPKGTVLEAAFVDPAYSWPPKDGEGRNAIELQATADLLGNDRATQRYAHGNNDDDNNTVQTTESMLRRMAMPEKPVSTKLKWWHVFLCRCKQSVVETKAMEKYERDVKRAERERHKHELAKLDAARLREKETRKKERYGRVPEGILIYRLDTSTRELSLMSKPHIRTNLDTLVRELRVVQAQPSGDKSRRGILFTGEDGTVLTLIATEQRTATAWLEAASLMLAKQPQQAKEKEVVNNWSSERLGKGELSNIEDQYMNLAGYSHNLIRAGALPGGKKGAGGAGGIYYSIEKVQASNGVDDIEEEALEVIAKRRAIIKDSWDFFRMICSLLRDRYKYDEVFRRMQLDPVYPYLNSMTGLNDPGDAGYENTDKPVMQRNHPEYEAMTQIGLARTLVQKAEAAQPSLIEICKALAGSLGMEEVGVGPIKDVDAALRKAEKKYNGDLLKVTDYCRALLVVRDFPSLLALLELARDSFGPLIRRVKMSSLRRDQQAKIGGYRDCIINVELKDHVCEIQVHLWPMWVVCGVDGFRHYRHCVEYKTDSFQDPYDALDGLDRKTMAELIVMAEEAVADIPLDNLEWYHEKYILDYFAEAGLFLKHGLDVWAEVILRHLIRLRTESPDIGPEHHETIQLHKYLAQALRGQGKYEEANDVMIKVKAAEMVKNKEKIEATKSLWDTLCSVPQGVMEYVVDPNKKEREQEEMIRKEVKQSKKQWRKIRQERFAFLDSDLVTERDETPKMAPEEKKVDPV